METSPLKIKTAVPVEVQRVLDAMTEENWCQGSLHSQEGRSCFLGHVERLGGTWLSEETDEVAPEWEGLELRIRCTYGLDGSQTSTAMSDLNDTASSLSDFKSKIIALYETEG